MKRIAVPLIFIGALALAGCSGMNRTEQRTLSGGAIGAGAGAITAIATDGCVACGAVIGGAVGAAAGFVYDQVKKHDN